jgi:hypothetical protein
MKKDNNSFTDIDMSDFGKPVTTTVVIEKSDSSFTGSGKVEK